MTHDKILQAAYEMVATQGYEKAALSQIAAVVGISKPALYYHFRSKDELFTTLYNVIVEQMIAGYEKQLRGWTKETFIDRLESIGVDELQTLRTDRYLAPALQQFFLIGLRIDAIRSETRRLSEATARFYETIVAYGVEFGFFFAEEAEESAKLLHFMNESLTAQAIDNNDATLEQIWRFFIKKLLIH